MFAETEFTLESPGRREYRLCFLAPILRASVVPWFLALFLVPAAHAQDQMRFRSITAPASIHFTHITASFRKKCLPETMRPGCGFIDFANVGYPCNLLINGDDFPGHPHAGATTLKLYHNNH